ncbi:triphosphoribosyl-dephospho-CoA synthase [Methylomicrobium sp. Wu6]|uniref:triphosphoribosyl-dephospho-CoA synthase n=1 Tax=Methylomicrobium sp. Wu6 TaxID=3107928 RepID=UPI002DD653BC|nr:triphosphoribosyl-dephospho-CoA synthase [Methylomicrobium sp. Wu6]MEC4748976.1 triphosphoribosyl-dephospho-CoA synthase [Methylomicrobium sp. Wu6]
MIAPSTLEALFREACEIELQAFKPGNISVYADGHDMTVADFRRSAEASAGPLCNPAYSLGEKIYYAVKATREAVGCNTNLGIILLCAPLVQAAYQVLGEPLRQALRRVLSSTTIDDADWVFKAITLAAPGGLGSASEQDVHQQATVNLLEAMRLAASRDRIAFQYSSNYQDIFDFSTKLYYNVISGRIGRNWAALMVYAGLLSRFPDSHIERKYGDQFTGMVAARMAGLGDALLKAESPEQMLPLLYQIDQEFKSKGINPGTTADLTVATLFTVLLEDVLSEASATAASCQARI